MESITKDAFGPLVAFLVPGATLLASLRTYLPLVDQWFTATPENAPTLSGFLFLSVASLAVGMTISAIRWAVIDRLHAWTGLPPPKLDFSRLQQHIDAFVLLIEIHYHHYQFYANMFVATTLAYAAQRLAGAAAPAWGWFDGLFVAVQCVFYITSRDTLRKYYSRTKQLLAAP